MNFTECDGVKFYESFPLEYEKGAAVSINIGGMIKSSQLSTLKDVKILLAKECKLQNEEVLVGFTYGQKSSGMLASLFSRDDVCWYGKGFVGILK